MFSKYIVNSQKFIKYSGNFAWFSFISILFIVNAKKFKFIEISDWITTEGKNQTVLKFDIET